MGKLRLPELLTFVVIGGAVAAGATACDDDKPPIADAGADAAEPCFVFCIPEFTDDGGPVFRDAGECPACVDDQGNCPMGCQPVG